MLRTATFIQTANINELLEAHNVLAHDPKEVDAGGWEGIEHQFLIQIKNTPIGEATVIAYPQDQELVWSRIYPFNKIDLLLGKGEDVAAVRRKGVGALTDLRVIESLQREYPPTHVIGHAASLEDRWHQCLKMGIISTAPILLADHDARVRRYLKGKGCEIDVPDQAPIEAMYTPEAIERCNGFFERRGFKPHKRPTTPAQARAALPELLKASKLI